MLTSARLELPRFGGRPPLPDQLDIRWRESDLDQSGCHQ